MLTHVKLSYEAGDIVVFEVLGEQLLGKPLLIQNAEVLTILGNKQRDKSENKHSFPTVLLRSQCRNSTEIDPAMGKSTALTKGVVCVNTWDRKVRIQNDSYRAHSSECCLFGGCCLLETPKFSS